MLKILRAGTARAAWAVVAAVLALSAFAPPVPPAWAADLETRLWPTTENIRMVFESDRPLNYSLSNFDAPLRFVIDVQDSSGDVTPLNLVDVRASSAYVRSVRASRLDAKTLRVVFDLSADINYKVLRLRPVGDFRHRLVFDLQPQDAPDPLLALLRSLQEDEKPFFVLVDPGHGGEDPGAVSRNKNYEKNIVLKIAKKLVAEINSRDGMKAALTRDDDRFIKLFDRVHIANRLQADAFVSIHADSVQSTKARGSSVFVLSKRGASTKIAKRLAQQANLSDVIGGAANRLDEGGHEALRAISMDGKDRASRQLAVLILRQLGQINTLHSPRVESAGFAVLKSPFIPSVLVETAFISNPKEERKLLSADFQARLSAAIADALQEYHAQYAARK